MEYRTRYYAIKTTAICDDDEPDCAIDHITESVDFSHLEDAEDYALNISKGEKLDYPIRVEKRHEEREECEAGHTWKQGMGWSINYDIEPEIVSEWWEGKKET